MIAAFFLGVSVGAAICGAAVWLVENPADWRKKFHVKLAKLDRLWE